MRKRRRRRKLARHSYRAASRRNPIDSRTLLLVGVGVIGALALGYAIWANPSESSSPTTWPTTQFAPSQNNTQVVQGQYVLLLDAGSDQNIIAQVQSVGAGTATGIVVEAPQGAPESRGDVVNFNVSSAIASSSLPATLVA